MPDTDYSDIIAAATGDDTPRRTRKGALKYQPPDADWSLDRLPELQDFYQSTYKRPLPLAVKGQGSIHNKLGYDHRASADISLHPATAEGRALIAELQRRKIPFLAFEGAIPGASTGPHIHVGRPSSRVSNKYPVGSQVKKQPKAIDYSDVIAAATGGPAKPADALPPIEQALANIQRSANKVTGTVQARSARRQREHEQLGFGATQLPISAVAAGVRDYEAGQRQAQAAAVDAYERQATQSSGLGQLRATDEAALVPRRAVEAEVRGERSFKRAIGMPVTYNPITAVQEYLAGEERVVQDETNARMSASYAETERLREIASQFTDEDKRQLAAALDRMRGQGAVSRGIETGAQRFGSGLLYKLAAIADALESRTTIGLAIPNGVLSDYLRRQAGRGEIAVSEIEADLPPPVRQQLADFLTHSVAALPEMAGAVAVGGPIGGFAALGGLEASGRKLPFSTVARETAKGAVIGGVFAGAGAAESGLANRTFAQRAADTARSGAAIGLGTIATEKVFGATDEEALRAAATNVFFHTGMRVPGEIGRLAQAAEKAYKTPPSEGGTPTVGPELQERLSRTETPATPPAPAPLVTGTAIPPAELVTRPPSATPAAEPVAAEAAAPSLPRPIIRPLGKNRFAVDQETVSGRVTHEVKTLVEATMLADRLAQQAPVERRGPNRTKDADWLELTPEERARVRQEVDLEQQAGAVPAEEPITRRPLADLMRERAEGSPAAPVSNVAGEIARAQNFQGKPHEVSRQLADSPLRDKVLAEIPAGSVLAGTEATAPEMHAGPIRLRTPGGEIVEVDLAYNHRKDPAWKKFGGWQEGFAVRKAGPEAVNLLTGKPVERRPTEGEEGIFNLRALFGSKKKPTPDELRKQLDREDAEAYAEFQARIAADRAKEPFLSQPRSLKELGERYSELASRMMYLNNHIADARRFSLSKAEVDALWKQHADTLREAMATEKRITDQGYRVNPLGEIAREGEPFPSSKRGGERGAVDLTEVLAGLNELRTRFAGKSERELRNMLPPLHREVLDREQPLHHATQQPRTDTGQFAPGSPGSTEAARSQLRSEARKYGQQYKALDLHQARREGLDIVNDDVARNYFSQLHRMAAEFLPAQASAVDRAETLYNQGKYGQATMLAESVFRSLPDKVNEYAGADAAIGLVELGLTPKANWSKVLQEVRERLQRTGGLSGGGSTFYDVNKYPEGGRPDHAKIAYILEPVVDALKADARRLIAEGKLKATDYVDHVRRSVNEMLKREEFSDWHPLNKSAAMGVLVDKLRKDGPPPVGEPPATEAQPPAQRQRSLPKTLEKSGRDPGTNLTYDRLPNRQVNERVEARLEAEGAEALETWYRNAPESADRTAAHRVLVDHYSVEAVRLADTAPEAAISRMQRARDLDNLESERSTTMGQATQMYSNLLKYTPAGVVNEIGSLVRKGAKISDADTIELTKAAQRHQQLDKEVKRLEQKVAALEAEEAGVEGAEAPTRPRRYRSRPSPTIDISKAEAARRQLDEAAQRRRAQKAFIDAQLRAMAQQQTAAGYWKRSMNVTRGLMVSAFATAMRNLQTQALRFDIERLDDLAEHTIRRTVGLDSDLTTRNILRNTGRQFRPGQTAEARELLKGHEAEYWRMFNTYAGGVDVVVPTKARTNIERVFQTVEKGVEIANFFNRIQEHHVRSAEFLAELDLHLRKDKGQSLEQFVQRNGIDAIPLDTVRKGVDKALEVTFSDMPLKDGAGGRFLTAMIEVGNYIPPTLSPVAFPRFMFNNLKFLYQHSPAGMLDLARKNQNRPRVIARSLVGTSMLLLAYQFRNSDHAGEKWYEVKLGDATLDARPFGPFSTYLFMAEALRRQLNGEKAFTVEEIAGAIGASTGPSGTAIATAEKLYDYAANGKWDKWQRILKTEAGEWGRALLTPVRQVKDLVAAFDASQAVMRDTSAEPFLGEIRESIPYADTDLPPAHKPTSAAPIRQERPAAKALTGWRVITPKSFVERELDSLNFTSREIRPNTGNAAIDSLEKRLMGPLMDELSTELENDAEYKSMSRKAKGAYLRERLSEIRSEVRAQGKDEQPELYEQLQEERKPERQRQFEEELNSPGLSKAIELGVPMAIPPKRADEDDIAYRARLLQLGRRRRQRLDAALVPGMNVRSQRSALHSALYS